MNGFFAADFHPMNERTGYTKEILGFLSTRNLFHTLKVNILNGYIFLSDRGGLVVLGDMQSLN